MYEKIIHIYFIYKQNWIGISIAMTFRQNGLRPILAAQENLTVLMGMKQKKIMATQEKIEFCPFSIFFSRTNSHIGPWVGSID